MSAGAGRARITKRQFDALVAAELPFAAAFGFRLERLGRGTARCRAVYRPDWLRPGGTVAGPVLMGLADFCLYAAVLSEIGPVGLAVTTSLTTNFLRRPLPGDVVAEARLLKGGRRLVYGEVSLFSDGDPAAVAHVTGTYSVPPAPAAGGDAGFAATSAT